MSKQLPILPARFRLDADALRDYNVNVLDFPFTTALDRFIDGIKQVRGKRLKYREYPPWQSLNHTLLAVAPTLTYAFERKGWRRERQMLVIGEDEARRPSVTALGDVIRVWLRQWVDRCFATEVDGAAADLYDELMDGLNHPEADWRTLNAYELWQKPNSEDGLSYRAIPSLLCSLMKGQSSTIRHNQVIWRLAHSGKDGFVVVSTPLYSQYVDDWGREGEGTFAYKLEFRVQTQAGASAPRWIHLYVRCQRYADRPIARTNYRRDVSVLIGTGRPRLADWPQDSTLITIPVGGKVGNLYWKKGTLQLLETLKARGLVEAEELFASPQMYRRHKDDEYYVVYAEGMKYVRGKGRKHGVKTGFGLRERSEVVAQVAGLLEDVLTPGESLEADHKVQRGQRPWGMRTYKDLVRSRISRAEKRGLVAEALMRALGGKPLQITIAWHTAATRDALLQALRDLFFLKDGEQWPQQVQVIVLPQSNGALAEPLPEQDARNLKQRSRMLRRKVHNWRGRLASHQPERGYHLALIEFEEAQKDIQNIKGAIRQACIELGIASQMLHPVRVTKSGLRAADKGKTENAVADLVLRQTGTLFGLPGEIYQKAGLREEIAEGLTVTTVHRHSPRKTDTRSGANYAFATRLLPSGCVQGKLPDGKGWRPYLEASLDVGRAFLRGEASRPNERLAKFAADVLTETEGPTLMLLDAIRWRSYKLLGQLVNEKMLENELEFTSIKGHHSRYSASQLPGLRAVRLRERGALGETPQYVSTADGDWDDITKLKEVTSVFGAGFEDIYAGKEFLHYLSIGRLPTTVSRQQKSPPKDKDIAKSDFGGSVAFKYQTAVEFVPFFLQEDDEDPLPWCRAAHYLRISPAWDGGNTLRPYPLHLAYAAVNDQMCLLGYEDT